MIRSSRFGGFVRRLSRFCAALKTALGAALGAAPGTAIAGLLLTAAASLAQPAGVTPAGAIDPPGVAPIPGRMPHRPGTGKPIRGGRRIGPARGVSRRGEGATTALQSVSAEAGVDGTKRDRTEIPMNAANPALFMAAPPVFCSAPRLRGNAR